MVSKKALRSGAEAVLAQGGSVFDLRADAWGHGVAEVARIVLDAGASAVLVDEVDLAPLTALGMQASCNTSPDADSSILFGLPGSGVRPALRLTGAVLSTKPLEVGDGVSYGYLYRASRRTRVALVTGGYAQGVVRSLGNRAHVEIRGDLHPVVGRVAMDVCVVEIGDALIEEGDEVIYFGGDGPAAQHLAEWSSITGLAAAELVTVVGMNARREHVS
nr:alanine racemase C-terminal domain-containing protein [Microbacterium esteraromaticum]